MMHKKMIAWQRVIPMAEGYRNDNIDTTLFELLYLLSSEFSINPNIYLDNDNVIWVHYEHSCYPCNDIFEQFGISVALVSQKYPVYIYGNANRAETAEISAKVVDVDSIVFQKLNISGMDFDEITDLCIKIETESKEKQLELNDVLCNISYKNQFITVKRTQYTEKIFADIKQISEDTFYRIIPIDEDAQNSQAIFSLSLSQKKKLWMLLLKDKISAVEFDYVIGSAEVNEAYSMFSWEMALRLALSETKTKITYDNTGFHITDSNGGRISYDYTRGTSAQKLFLKIVFPVSPKRG